MFKTFYIDTPSTDTDQTIFVNHMFNELTEFIKEYEFLSWLISYEEYNSKHEYKPHFHFFMECKDEKPFNNYTKKVLSHYNLKELGKQIRQQTGKSGYRNYGVLKKSITDKDYFLTYLCKDKNIRHSKEFTKKQIQEYIDKSFNGSESLKIREKCLKWLKNPDTPLGKFRKMCPSHFTGNERNVATIRIAIISYLKENDHDISKTKVENILLYYMRKTDHFNLTNIFRHLYF